MKISWRGHASFLIETGSKRIVTDPFNAELGYPLVPIQADLVTISHNHWDHNAAESVIGKFRVLTGEITEDLGWVKVKGIASYHDRNQGRDRGNNTIFRFDAEGMSLVHLGDLGHLLTDQQVKTIGNPDILLVPVGGKFTIDAAEAVKVVNQLKPKIVVPMHYNTPHLSFALAPVEDFTSRFDKVIKKPRLEVNPDGLGGEMRIIILDYLCG